MTMWTSEELSKIGNTEELQIASLQHDCTLGKPVIIWVVRLGDDLYVRSVPKSNFIAEQVSWQVWEDRL